MKAELNSVASTRRLPRFVLLASLLAAGAAGDVLQSCADRIADQAGVGGACSQQAGQQYKTGQAPG